MNSQNRHNFRTVKYFSEVPVVNGLCSVVNILEDGVEISCPESPISPIDCMVLVLGLNTDRPG